MHNFSEPAPSSFDHVAKAGWIEIICGSMFSGKTEELIRRINRALIARQTVKVFKPSIDTRYHESDIVSHSEVSQSAMPIRLSTEILLYTSPGDVIAIDEAQFFEDDLVQVCTVLANNNHRVIIAGLDTDSQGNPFGPIPFLMAKAELVSKLHAICTQCGNMANFTYRTASPEQAILIGGKESYEARCRKCYNQGIKSKEVL